MGVLEVSGGGKRSAEQKPKRQGFRLPGTLTKADKAVELIGDRAVVAISGFNMATTPEFLIVELYKRYSRTGHPRDLFLIVDALPATPGRALDRVSMEMARSNDSGMVRGISVPFLGFAPALQQLVEANAFEAYSWPMGVAAYWFREVASGRPGVISKIGIDTAIDPRKGGGALNEKGLEKKTCSVKMIKIDEEDYLLYEAPKPEFAMIRGSTCDPRGNLSMEDEPIRGTVLSIAQATKAHPSPGVVIAQVRQLSKEPIAPRAVEVPGPFIDFVVLAPNSYHWQTGSTPYNPAYSYSTSVEPMVEEEVEAELHELVIARRVLVELMKTAISKGSPVLVNLGIGIPALVSRLAIQEGVEDHIVTVIESGQWGGLALSGVDFGVAEGPFALSTMPDMFSNFEGGIIDAASLGFLQVGENGDVNPSMLPGRMYGPGGFPVIAGGSPRIYFAGAFTAGKTRIGWTGSEESIIEEGSVVKFVPEVYRNFFSAKQALGLGKEVLYITERAVFRLSAGGLVLEEVAPGVDLDKDIVSKMGFKPLSSRVVREMDAVLFKKGKMGLRSRRGVSGSA